MSKARLKPVDRLAPRIRCPMGLRDLMRVDSFFSTVKTWKSVYLKYIERQPSKQAGQNDVIILENIIVNRIMITQILIITQWF